MPDISTREQRRANILDRVEALTRLNKQKRNPRLEERIALLRHKAAKHLNTLDDGITPADRFKTDMFKGQKTLPEINAKDLTVDHLASGLLFHGGLLVRGLFNPKQVKHLHGLVAYAMENDIPVDASSVYSPFFMFELTEIYKDCGLLDCIDAYHDGDTVMMAERTRLRYQSPKNHGGLYWHQDVNFFGKQFFAVNCWSAITPCGVNNPGLKIIPRRMTQRLGWDSETTAPLDYGRSIPDKNLLELTEDTPIASPIFEPGDALLFDEMTMHATSDSSNHTAEQIVAISWFFKASRMPKERTPLAIPK